MAPGPQGFFIAVYTGRTFSADQFCEATIDRIRVEIEGFALRGYWNDMLVLEATDTDASRIDDGAPGLAARWATGNTGTPAAVKVWEGWAGGSL